MPSGSWCFFPFRIFEYDQVRRPSDTPQLSAMKAIAPGVILPPRLVAAIAPQALRARVPERCASLV